MNRTLITGLCDERDLVHAISYYTLGYSVDRRRFSFFFAAFFSTALHADSQTPRHGPRPRGHL